MTAKTASPGKGSLLSRIVKNQIFIPIAALLVLTIFNLIVDPSFFEITLKPSSEGYRIFSGNVISILDYGSELAILAIGMTLVTASSRGQDISVGAVMAISGSVVLRVLCGTNSHPDSLQSSIIVAFLISCLVAMAFGAFNGILVSVFNIQPMVATLILFTAGRSIAAWINNNELPVVHDKTFWAFGNVFSGVPIPTPIFIAILCFIATALLMKITTLGLYVQSVGINEKTSRLNGLNPALIKFITYVLLGVCVAVAGFIKVSRIETINYSVIAKDIEMDAILAVALGGNSLGGGKFNITASVLGAYVIQFLTTTLYKLQVNSEALPAYKAVVVIVLVILSAPVVREKTAAFFRKLRAPKNAESKG